MSEHQTALIIVGLGNAFAALLVVGLSIPLARRKIPMNRWYGVRFPKAYLSEENWFRYNEMGGRILIGWFLPVLVIGLIAAALGWRGVGEKWALFLSVGSALVATAGAVIQIVLAGRRLPGR